MEQALIKLIDDIREMEEAIALRIKEETFSEKILPSTSLEEVADTIYEHKDSEGKKKAIKTIIDGKPLINPLTILTTPEFILNREDIDLKKNMKEQIINIASINLTGLWDKLFLDLADSAAGVRCNVITRNDKSISRDDIIGLFGLLELKEIDPGYLLMHKDTFNKMLMWGGVKTEKKEFHEKLRTAAETLDKYFPNRSVEIVISCNDRLQDKVYTFGKYFGSSFMSTPELKIFLHKKGIAWEVRIMTARNIGNWHAIGKSEVKE